MQVHLFYHVKYILPLPLACTASVEKPADSLMGVPCLLSVTSPLLLFTVYLRFWFLSVSLLRVSLCSSSGWSCLGLPASWTWLTISFPTLGNFSAISSNIFSGPFSLSSPSGTPIMQMLVHILPQRSQAIFVSFHSFSVFCPVAVISTILSSRSLICSSASVNLLLIPSRALFVSSCSLIPLGLWETFFASFPLCCRAPGSSSLSLL